MLQLHLSDHEFNCLLRCNLYQRFDSSCLYKENIWHMWSPPQTSQWIQDVAPICQHLSCLFCTGTSKSSSTLRTMGSSTKVVFCRLDLAFSRGCKSKCSRDQPDFTRPPKLCKCNDKNMLILNVLNYVEKKNLQFQYLSFLHTAIKQVVEILPHERQWPRQTFENCLVWYFSRRRAVTRSGVIFASPRRFFCAIWKVFIQKRWFFYVLYQTLEGTVV